MTWLIISTLCLITGLLRYLDGAGAGENAWAARIPGFVFNALIGLMVALTAWVASSNLSVSIIAGVNAAVCITLGQTKWESWKWQTIRGSCFGMLLVLLSAQFYSMPEWSWLIVGLYTIAYVSYSIGYHKFTGQWERTCRWIQGFCICGAASLL